MLGACNPCSSKLMRQLTQAKANAERPPQKRGQPGECLGGHESTKSTHSGTLPMPETAGTL